MVDRRRQLVEEPLKAVEVDGVERGDAGSELQADAVHTIWVAGREDHVGPLLAGTQGRLEPDAGAVADHHEGVWPPSGHSRLMGPPPHDPPYSGGKNLKGTRTATTPTMSCELLQIYYVSGAQVRGRGKSPLDPRGETRMLVLSSLMGTDSIRHTAGPSP
jgi:hypothetical protein